MKRVLLVLLAAVAALRAEVKLTQGSDRILVEIDGKPYADFFIGAETTKPYLYPLRTASGKAITRHWPMETIEGEPHDHQHHRGLWFSHGDVNGVDFWANEASYNRPGLGRIVIRKVLDLKSGKKSGSLTALFDWNDPAGKTILTETRTMTFYSHPTLRTIDVDITLTAKDQKVAFGDTKEGSFAIRLAAPLQEDKGSGRMTNAQGAEGEKSVWGQKSEWVDYAGTLEGEKLGVAIFDHPQNPNHPERWHARAYGLFAVNPFGLAEFVKDKKAVGGLSIEPNGTMRFRYRVVIHPGDAKAAGIAELYKKYAAGK